MTDQQPISPFKLTPARLMLLGLGLLAIVMIAGAILGGVGNYQDLRDARDAALSSSAAAASSNQP